MKRKTLEYCTYHSCFLTSKMIEKHGCFEKDKHGRCKCKYIVCIYEAKKGALADECKERNEA